MVCNTDTAYGVQCTCNRVCWVSCRDVRTDTIIAILENAFFLLVQQTTSGQSVCKFGGYTNEFAATLAVTNAIYMEEKRQRYSCIFIYMHSNPT